MFRTFVAESHDVREALYRLRYEIFTAAQQKYRNIADHERRKLVDSIDEHAVHLCLESDGELIGSMRQLQGLEHVPSTLRTNLSLEKFVQFPSSAFTFSGRLLILPAHRGSQALLTLVRFAFESGRSRRAEFDFIFCNPNLVRFYELMGWRRYRPYFEDPGLGFQVPMVLVADDVVHLEAIRSPFAELARNFAGDGRHARWFRETFPEYQHFVSPVTIGAEAFSEILAHKINDVSIDLFDRFEPDELKTLLQMVSHFEIAEQTRIIRQGAWGEELYLILNGVAEARRRTADGQLRILSTMGRGDVFGEMSVFTGRPRSADVVAQSGLEVVFLDRSSLEKLMKGQPTIAGKLLFNLCRLMSERVRARELGLE